MVVAKHNNYGREGEIENWSNQILK